MSAGIKFMGKDPEGKARAVRVDKEGKVLLSDKNINMILSRKPDEVILGATWDKGETPTLTREEAAKDLVANVGVDRENVRNDFDAAPIFGEIKEVEDELGNIFMRIPKFFIRKAKGTDYRGWWVSKTEYPGFYLPWCFWDFDNNKALDYFDFGKHKGSYDGNGNLCSIPDVAPKCNQNIVQFRTAAQKNNAGGIKGYQQLDIHAVDILRTLAFIEFGTLNIQSIMTGYTNGIYGKTHAALINESDTNSIVITNAQASNYEIGQTVSISTAAIAESSLPNIAYGCTITNIETDVPESGQATITFDGDPVNISIGDYIQNTGFINGFSKRIAASSGSIINNDTGKFPCIYRGIESPFGDMWQFVDGVNITPDWQAWITENTANYASNTFAFPYKQLGYTNAQTTNYVKEMGLDPNFPFAEFPVAVISSGQTKYYSDYYYQASVTNYIARVGGSWSNGAYAGLSYWSLNHTSSYSYSFIGGRLLKKAL
jgi:hypothetical protein